jgi:hypothetical protein
LIERDSTAATIHLIPTEQLGSTDLSQFDATFWVCDADELRSLLRTALRALPRRRLAVYCPEATVDLVRRRAQSGRFSRVVIPSQTDSVVLRTGPVGVELLAASVEPDERDSED